MIGRSGHFRIAVESLRSSKWRAMLTMLGIVIGVVSVVTTVSLGEGAKQSVIAQINKSGESLITIRPSVIGSNNNQRLDLFGITYQGTLSDKDYEALRKVKDIGSVAPFSFITNSFSKDKKNFDGGVVIGTSYDLPVVLGQKLQYGSFFKNDEPQHNTAVIGPRVAQELFGENVPIGKYMNIRDEQFIVKGIFEPFETSSIVPSIDYNSAVFIQYETGRKLTDRSDIYQILVKPPDDRNVNKMVSIISDTLKANHGGQKDFTVLRQEDKLAETSEMLTIMTTFVAGIAAISLIVGGIGILNIMLVSVTERTHEIGVRKAIGATNRQIVNQFLTEAVILSGIGGIFGIVLSLFANYLFRIFTSLTPVLTWPIVVIAFLVSISVGIIFGVTPAISAARKKPIDALRYE